MSCVNCGKTDTDWFKNDDGHYKQECPACGHVGGPYVSEVTTSPREEEDEEEEESEVSTLDEWLS